MAKTRYSLGILFVGFAAAAVAFTFLFLVVPQFLHYASESRTSPFTPLGLTVFFIYLVVTGWWQIRGGARPGNGLKPPSDKAGL